MVGLSALANPGWSTPAVDVEAVLSTLPLPPDIDPPTFASAAPPEEVFAARSSRKKLVLGKPVADGNLQSGFGMRRHPILGSSRMHTGVDWVTRIGAPIMAAGDGAVIKAERAVGYGLRVEIQHADGVVTTYSHMSRFGRDIAPGTEVRQGQVIGFLGSTGLSTGPHLHYEVMVNGHFVDPMEIYVPEGASVAAKVEKTTSPADEQAAIIPAERIAALQTRQSPAAKTSAALAAPLQQPSPKPVQSAEHTPLQRIAAAPTQHQTQVEPVPLPPIRLASLGPAEPAADVGQTRSEAPKPNGATTNKAATRQQTSAPRVTPPPIGPSKAQPQPPLVNMAKAEPVKPAEPRTGTLPKTEQQGGEAASEQNLRSGPVKAPQIAFAAPNQASAKPGFRSPLREVTPPAPLPSLANLSASSGGAVERATAPSPRTPDSTPVLLRPGLTGRTQTSALAQPLTAAAAEEAARKRNETRLQAQEKRLRMTLKSICIGC
jgi:murein DD-endopeptidase MepM/ murein hydrolase activator NlpD